MSEILAYLQAGTTLADSIFQAMLDLACPRQLSGNTECYATPRGNELAVLHVAQANEFRRNGDGVVLGVDLRPTLSTQGEKGGGAVHFIAGRRSGRRGDPRDTSLPPFSETLRNPRL